MNTPHVPSDVAPFLRDLRALGKELLEDRRPSDVTHLARIAAFGRGLTVLGLGTAWWGLNPLSVLSLALGASIRWTIVAHHVLHGAFDGHPDAPAHWQSTRFAKGWRRFIDWADWLPRRAWMVEHNTLHHHRLGEDHDPDVPEANFAWLRRLRLPRPLAALGILICAAVWRPIYYGPNTVRQLLRRRAGDSPVPFEPLASDVYLPTSALGRQVWLQVWLPTLLLRFVVLPACFLPLGLPAAVAVLLNLVFAEILTNLHTFAVIVPSHSGDDVLRFDTPPASSDESAVRQLFGTVNYRTGGAVNDVLCGYLNYQLEHHVWPHLSPAQLIRAQPRLEELCVRHGMPYRQQSVWRRNVILFRNALGSITMPRASSVLPDDASAPPAEPDLVGAGSN